MSHALVPVPASNEKHSRPVRNSPYNGAASNNSTSRVHLLAGANVTSKSTTITGPSG